MRETTRVIIGTFLIVTGFAAAWFLHPSDSVPDHPCAAAVQVEPVPHYRDGTHDYWMGWCRAKYGQPIEKDARQDALDWADHCTMVGDAK